MANQTDDMVLDKETLIGLLWGRKKERNTKMNTQHWLENYVYSYKSGKDCPEDNLSENMDEFLLKIRTGQIV